MSDAARLQLHLQETIDVNCNADACCDILCVVYHMHAQTGVQVMLRVNAESRVPHACTNGCAGHASCQC